MKHLVKSLVSAAIGKASICLMALVLPTFFAIAKPRAIKLKDLVEKPKRYVGSTITVTGRYKGWKETCQGSGIRSRSDWLIASQSGCVYVSGIKPAGLSPSSPHDQGLKVEGILRTNANGKPYLEATQVTLLPPDQCNCD